MKQSETWHVFIDQCGLDVVLTLTVLSLAPF